MPVPPLSEGLVTRRLRVRAADVVFVKGIIEANRGVATLFAETGGEITLAAPPSRETELAELIDDLRRELQVVLNH